MKAQGSGRRVRKVSVGSATPMQITATRLRAPVAHPDASCAQGLNGSGETHRCSWRRSLHPSGGWCVGALETSDERPSVRPVRASNTRQGVEGHAAHVWADHGPTQAATGERRTGNRWYNRRVAQPSSSLQMAARTHVGHTVRDIEEVLCCARRSRPNASCLRATGHTP